MKYRYKDRGEELYCPNCYSDLRKQNFFDENQNVNVCEICGAELINPNCDDEMAWHCNKCDDIMNNQYSWIGETYGLYKCSNCGAYNDLSDPDSMEYWESEDEYETAHDNQDDYSNETETYDPDVDEYFCPKCNSDLRKQHLFDENQNVNVCEICGAELINPNCDDEMVWHCNKCEDIMNNQYSWIGETYGLYKCSNCGAYNDLSDPDSMEYWESEEAYKAAKNDQDNYSNEMETNEVNVDEFFCPKCNSDLRKQYLFDENQNVNVCEICGAELINPNCDDEMVWHCNKCNDIMNNQSTWKGEIGLLYRCENCGAFNDLSDPDSLEYWEDGVDSKEDTYEFSKECDRVNLTQKGYEAPNVQPKNINSDLKNESNEYTIYSLSQSRNQRKEVSKEKNDRKSFKKEKYETANYNNFVKGPIIVTTSKGDYALEEIKPSLLLFEANNMDVIIQIASILTYFFELPYSYKTKMKQPIIQAIYDWDYILKHMDIYGDPRDTHCEINNFVEVDDKHICLKLLESNFESYNVERPFDYPVIEVLNYNFIDSIKAYYKMHFAKLGMFSFEEKKKLTNEMNLKIQLVSNYWSSRLNYDRNKSIYDYYYQLNIYKTKMRKAPVTAFKYKKECREYINELLNEIKTINQIYEVGINDIKKGYVPYYPLIKYFEIN